MLFSLYAKYLEAPVQLSFLNHQVHDVPIITALSTAEIGGRSVEQGRGQTDVSSFNT